MSQHRPEFERHQRWFGRTRYLFAAIVLLVAAVFSPLLRADFTAWDDPDTLVNNPKLHPPTWGNLADYWTTAGDAAPMGLYVPVTYTVWSLGSIPDGPRPTVIHALNISLHAITAGLVFVLLRRIATIFPAVVGSLVFGLHPVQVEAVGWASGTKDLLCGFFSVATVLIESAPGRSRWMRTVAFACFLLAMLSKPTAMVVPILLVMWDLVLGHPSPQGAARSGTVRSGKSNEPLSAGRVGVGRTLLRRLPWFVASAVCAIVTAISQPVPWQPTLAVWTRPVVALDAIAFYLGKLAWPAKLCVDYGRSPNALFESPAVWWTWLIPLATVALVFRNQFFRPHNLPTLVQPGSGRRSRFLAPVCFVAPLLPVLGFTPFDFQYFSTVADHYLYLSMTGVAISAAIVLPGRPSWKITIPVATLIGVYGLLSIRQQQTWMDTSALARNIAAVNPHTFAGHDLAGYDHRVRAIRATSPDLAANEREMAIAEYQLALANNPDYIPSLTNLAYVQHQAGFKDDALRTLHKLVDLQDSLPPRLRTDPRLLGRELYDYGDPEGAMKWASTHTSQAQ